MQMWQFPPCEPPGLLPSHARVCPRFMSASERREIVGALLLDGGSFSLACGAFKLDGVAPASRAVVGAADRIAYSPRPADESHKTALQNVEPSCCGNGA